MQLQQFSAGSPEFYTEAKKIGRTADYPVCPVADASGTRRLAVARFSSDPGEQSLRPSPAGIPSVISYSTGKTTKQTPQRKARTL